MAEVAAYKMVLRFTEHHWLLSEPLKEYWIFLQKRQHVIIEEWHHTKTPVLRTATNNPRKECLKSAVQLAYSFGDFMCRKHAAFPSLSLLISLKQPPSKPLSVCTYWRPYSSVHPQVVWTAVWLEVFSINSKAALTGFLRQVAVDCTAAEWSNLFHALSVPLVGLVTQSVRTALLTLLICEDRYWPTKSVRTATDPLSLWGQLLTR
jgi:hypothetical protein